MPAVTVRLYAGLRKYASTQQLQVEVRPGETVAAVLDRVGVPQSVARIVFVDHRRADPDTRLQGGEQVAVFPAVGGG